MQTVRPVAGFDAQELITCGVSISAGEIAGPSRPTRATPVIAAGAYHAPLGTYAVTWLPRVSTAIALEPPHRAATGCGCPPAPIAVPAGVPPSLPPHPQSPKSAANRIEAQHASDQGFENGVKAMSGLSGK